ncbi:MAG: hypothetical protein BMS9Abin02_0625 [Anaerolineae bacterium]|nr:MAG: hypothetical protein BMS9Abin02_0625 [Anaerolineae bacterium]
MSLLILIVKIVVVAAFLVMFLRTSRAIWGVGLLTVTSAILLDTILSTFSREEILTELGFFYFVIAGALMAGAAFWLWGLLKSWLSPKVPQEENLAPTPAVQAVPLPKNETSGNDLRTAYDRQELVDQIHDRFSYDDLLDLVFDLGLNENDVFVYGQHGNQAIVNIVMQAEAAGQSTQLALAVERILTPVTADHLPRLEKLDPNSPPTILRHFLLTNYSIADLQQISLELDVDWETIAGDGKKAKVRNLLLYLYRRNRIGQLVELFQSQALDEDLPSADEAG